MDSVDNLVGDRAPMPGQLALFPDPRRVAGGLPPIPERWFYRARPRPPWGLVDAPWHVLLAAERRAEELDRQAWLDELVERWGLVLRP